MSLHPSLLRPYTASARRTYRRKNHRPWMESLEDRTVMTAGAAAHEAVDALHAHAHAMAAGQHAHVAIAAAHPAAHRAHAAAHAHHHRKHHHASTNPTPTPSPSPSPTPTPAPVATATPAPAPAPAASGALASLMSPAAGSSAADPTILNLSLNPIDLNLLGLEVQLYGADTSSPVTVTVSAQPGSGQLLGNLLTTVGGLLNTQGVSNALDTVLNNVVSLANNAVLSVNGLTGSTTYTSTTQVLDAHIAPVNLDLLGAVVTTSPINLVIQAHSGTGLVLGNIVTDLANLLNSPTGNLVKDIESGLTNLLTQLNTQFPNIPSSIPSPSPTPTPTSTGSFQLLSLAVPPIDLNLLGLILQTSTIQVNATSQSGNGDLLGNLINDLLNTAHASQSDLDTINGDLNGVLEKVVGILNATTLSLPSGILSTLSPTLQELASPTLIDTSGATIPPEPVLNLNIASTTSSSPPVDVDLLGVVVTTSNIQVQLLAQPGQGQILGNLVYNVSHLLDGGLLSVLGILNTLGV